MTSMLVIIIVCIWITGLTLCCWLQRSLISKRKHACKIKCIFSHVYNNIWVKACFWLESLIFLPLRQKKRIFFTSQFIRLQLFFSSRSRGELWRSMTVPTLSCACAFIISAFESPLMSQCLSAGEPTQSAWVLGLHLIYAVWSANARGRSEQSCIQKATVWVRRAVW